ncbi:arf-GAP with Rho-GAP domain, ANK repeat and PH domain-containing protein 3 [Protopterus annectens]|uniref:arf-GAP with Rho-GAP domain, ANK repeat and PH domain-containing protein 3 n=1 Tax=Protopterus annectens TaxID=7888 RepID=UPI001CFB3553|nr:arf-GAP with Rho-GAP domain, ANK repeat and PH domain-containing protein 3 [Protopterus annectens]
MATSCGEDSEVGHLLSTIHLGRYHQTLQDHGFCTAKDLLCLDSESLQKMGITATGHRKRILKLVELLHLTVQSQDEQTEEKETEENLLPVALAQLNGQTHGVTELSIVVGMDCGAGHPGEELSETSVHLGGHKHDEEDHSATLSSYDLAESPTRETHESIQKPVPKPRTVFGKPTPPARRTENSVPVASKESLQVFHDTYQMLQLCQVQEVSHQDTVPSQQSLPVLHPDTYQMLQPCQAQKLSHQDSISQSVTLEGFFPGESSTDIDDQEHELEHSYVNTQTLARSRSSESLVQGDKLSDVLPALPPRQHAGVTASNAVSLSPTLQTNFSFLCSPPQTSLSAGTRDTASTSFAHSHPDSSGTELHMVHNEIYAGLSVLDSPLASFTESILSSMPGQEHDHVSEQEITSSQEHLSPLSRSNMEPPDVPARSSRFFASDSIEDSMDIYCDNTFNRTPAQQKKVSEKSWDQTSLNLHSTPDVRNNEETVQKEEKEKATSKRISQIPVGDLEGYATLGSPAVMEDLLLPSYTFGADDYADELTISPYASFTSLSEKQKPIISGWLDKLSPQGSYVFQKRFVKFDGVNLMYFGNDKDIFPKGVIPLAAIQMARTVKDNKFEIVTSQRTFVFKAESEAQRNEWCKTVQRKVEDHHRCSLRPRLGLTSCCKKYGYLEMKGYKSKIFATLSMDQVWLYKNEQSFKTGIGITLIDMHGSTIRDAKGKGFELITAHKTFSFTADSDREKKEWMEALQESIAETFSDYEVAEKIWSNKSNRSCADCKAINPDWASINLCVVICKKCAGQHRGLGANVSKVQSLKLDTSIWSNEIVQLFIVLGNEKVNSFWAAKLTPEEVIDHDSTVEQRREFIIQKYRDGTYRRSHPRYQSQEEILKALCTAINGPNLLKTVIQFFSEALSTAEAGESDTSHQQSPDLRRISTYSQPGLELPDGNSVDTIRVYDEIVHPVLLREYLYKSTAISKSGTLKRNKDEFHKRWCCLGKSLLFYESEKSTEPTGKVEMGEVVCLGVCRSDTLSNPGPSDRFRYVFELFLSSEKVYHFGTDSLETLQNWTTAIGKWFTPLSCHCLIAREFKRVGKLRYKAMVNPDQWKEGFFVLHNSNLFICPEEKEAAEDAVNLKQLQELNLVPHTESSDKKDALVLVEKGRTLHVQGTTRMDFPAWHTDIQAAAGGKGNSLRDQQLSRNDIPIIVDSCIAFITQYGLRHEGIYRKNGAKSRIKLLIEEFRKDARNVKLRIGENFIEDVTDVLKRFFREIDDPVFMADLHPLWKEAAEVSQKASRLNRYKELIHILPKVNRTTLSALIGHLYRVQKCSDMNHMNTKNLSLLFAPTLFQSDGKGEHEVKIIEDLIDNYVDVFGIDEEQVSQMDLENSLITTWKDVQLSQAGDLIIEVYLEKKMPDCCVTLKVSPTMSAGELTNQVLDMRNITPNGKEFWLTFEAIENGELERPLHPKEKVLEQALQWGKLTDPSSAFLVMKKIPSGEGAILFSGLKSEAQKGGLLKCREEPPKLLGNKFQERYFLLQNRKLLLMKDKKSMKPEREWVLTSLKLYVGIRKKIKAPTQWGLTLVMDKQQLFLCFSKQEELWEWITSLLRAQHDDPQAVTVTMRRHSSSDLTRQKFGTMPLVPLRGDDTNSGMVTANQTLRQLHARRTLSMFFPMKLQQDSVEEQNEPGDTTDSEPVYEEVGDIDVDVLKSLRSSSYTDVSTLPLEGNVDSSLPKSLSLERTTFSSPGKAVASERTELPSATKALISEKTLTTDSLRNASTEKAFFTDSKVTAIERNLGLNVKSLAAERTSEPLKQQDLVKFPGKDYRKLQQGDRSLNPEQANPVPSERFPSAEPLKFAARRKSGQVPSPVQEKLLQELSSAIMKKNESASLT